MAQRIAITGIGLMTSIGANSGETWASIVAGRSGSKLIDRFPTVGLRTQFAATIDQFDGDGILTCVQRTKHMLNSVVDEAVRSARLDESDASPDDAEWYIAVPGGDVDWLARRQLALHKAERTDDVAERLVRESGITELAYADLIERYGIFQQPAILTTACASGASAIQLGVEAIRSGRARRAFAAAADSTCSAEGITRFSLLSALSRRNENPQTASRPFDRERDGFVMGEGAAALILEDEASARERGARILGFVAGCGDATDNFHRTRSDPSGDRIRLCIARAIEDAGISPDCIGYVNAHGTSTPENDKMEAMGLHMALAKYGSKVPVTSNKSMIGHTLAAAGLVEAAISVMSLQEATIPPSINVIAPDDTLELNVATTATSVPEISHVLSNSFGFGGQNVSIILARAG